MYKFIQAFLVLFIIAVGSYAGINRWMLVISAFALIALLVYLNRYQEPYEP